MHVKFPTQHWPPQHNIHWLRNNFLLGEFKCSDISQTYPVLNVAYIIVWVCVCVHASVCVNFYLTCSVTHTHAHIWMRLLLSLTFYGLFSILLKAFDASVLYSHMELWCLSACLRSCLMIHSGLLWWHCWVNCPLPMEWIDCELCASSP